MILKKTIKTRLVFTTIVLVLLTQNSFSQHKIIYEQFYNDSRLEQTIISYLHESKCYITSKANEESNGKIVSEIQLYDIKNNKHIAWCQLKDDRYIKFQDTITSGKFEFTHHASQTKKIAGYSCKKITTSINSNHIEIWYTNQLPYFGGPSLLGITQGTVLEITRNGNHRTTATKVDTTNRIPSYLREPTVEALTPLDYQHEIWKNKFERIPIFKNEQICFDPERKVNDSILRFANGTFILKKKKFPKIEHGQHIFLELTTQSNGDAYDRTGSVVLLPSDKENNFWIGLEKGINHLPTFNTEDGSHYQGTTITESYQPTIELMRFFTPFGIHHFNHIKLKNKIWHDRVSYRQDVSEFRDLFNNNEVWIGVFIGNYDKGGHRIDLEVTLHEGEKQLFENNKIIPLINTVNLLEMAGQQYGTMFKDEKGLHTQFKLEKPLKNVYLRYTTTGHGGWENGDEFVPKTNHIRLDQHKFQIIPWRQDCGSYRLYNPASGNFSNGLSSSDYSRSNWCPGTITTPTYFYVGDLEPGVHDIQIQIPQGRPEGNSFSAWNVSCILLGNE